MTSYTHTVQEGALDQGIGLWLIVLIINAVIIIITFI